MNHQDRDARLVRRGRLTWVLVTVQIALAALAIASTPFRQMRTAVCGDQCDFHTAAAALTGLAVAVVALAILTLVIVYLRRDRGERSWWIPLIGIGCTVIAILISEAVFTNALPTS